MKKYFYLAFCLLLILPSCSYEEDPESDSSKFLAYGYAEDFVKERLKDPKSAEFPELLEKKNHVKHIGNWEFEIFSYVISKNSFNANVKTPFQVVIVLDKENGTVGMRGLKIN